MVDIAQLVGRVMRTSDGKTEGYVLVPIFVEGGESPQGVVARSESEAGEAGEAGEASGAGGAGEVGGSEAGDGEGRRPKRQRQSPQEDEASEESDEGSSDGSEVDSEGPDGPPDASHGRYKVAVAVLRALMQHDDQLAATLRDLRARAGREGRLLTQEEVESDFPYFCERVDISALEETQTVSLDALWAAVCTLVELSTDVWDQRFGELQAYQDRVGDCRVPREWPENPPLGTWVNEQRKEKRKFDQGDERAKITPERIEQLNGIGFVWDPDADAWERHFRELQAYQADKGDCNVPRGWSENAPLGSWVHTQRVAKWQFDQGDERAKITPERIDRLNGISRRPLGSALRRAASVHGARWQLQCASGVERERAAGVVGKSARGEAEVGQGRQASEDHAGANRAAERHRLRVESSKRGSGAAPAAARGVGEPLPRRASLPDARRQWRRRQERARDQLRLATAAVALSR